MPLLPGFILFAFYAKRIVQSPYIDGNNPGLTKRGREEERAFTSPEETGLKVCNENIGGKLRHFLKKRSFEEKGQRSDGYGTRKKRTLRTLHSAHCR
ncbi:hypothetical protein KFK09_009349 [Dendrobium nobile]|uniref:Uncharacterized protein n=1 Tax=Dendrobium nobile TaxID=94219 RepID=A0A8T3BS72_DENNO|nr:hypothetical protein KFK09_009349 [Dendrobium nobile]